MDALKLVENNDIISLRIVCSLAGSNQYNLEETDYYGNTALLKACFLGRLEAAHTLIRFGANLKAVNYFGQNALTLATYAGDYALVRELLRHRSYYDFNLSSIMPALCVATLRQDKRLIQYFRNFDNQEEDIQTVHGLSPEEIQQMLKFHRVRKEQEHEHEHEHEHEQSLIQF